MFTGNIPGLRHSLPERTVQTLWGRGGSGSLGSQRRAGTHLDRFNRVRPHEERFPGREALYGLVHHVQLGVDGIHPMQCFHELLRHQHVLRQGERRPITGGHHCHAISLPRPAGPPRPTSECSDVFSSLFCSTAPTLGWVTPYRACDLTRKFPM